MTEYPFYRVYDENGEQYCDCGWEKHAQELIILNQTCSLKADRKNLTYKRIDAPKPIDPETVDVSVTPTEELEGLNQIMVKQLKNRYNDPTIFKRFVVGIDRAKMRLYDCEQKAQEDIVDSGQEEEYNDFKQKPKKSFAEFKF